MNYQQLTAGDVRQAGDEVKHKTGTITSTGAPSGASAHPNDNKGHWRPCNLLGHVILPIDLHAADFRRPLP